MTQRGRRRGSLLEIRGERAFTKQLGALYQRDNYSIDYLSPAQGTIAII